MSGDSKQQPIIKYRKETTETTNHANSISYNIGSSTITGDEYNHRVSINLNGITKPVTTQRRPPPPPPSKATSQRKFDHFSIASIDELESDANGEQHSFNKYGFVSHNNSANKNDKSAPMIDDIDDTSWQASSTASKTINLKGYLQRADVEQFSEKLPIKTRQSREIKWLEMLSNFDHWRTKRYKKVKSRCRKGIPQSMRSTAWLKLEKLDFYVYYLLFVVE